MHQATGNVVDEHQQGAHRSAALEPAMLRAVYLDQFADTVAPIAGLVDTWPALLTRRPETFLGHPEPNSLSAKADVVQLTQLLSGHGRAEIGIALPDDRQSLGANVLWFASVATPATLL